MLNINREGIVDQNEIKGINFINMIIEETVSDNVRTYKTSEKTHIICGCTSDTRKEANALAHSKYLINLAKKDDQKRISWHFCVDDKNIVQSLPINETSWCFNDGENGIGNNRAIAIMVCCGENYELAKTNATILVEQLQTTTNIVSNNIHLLTEDRSKHPVFVSLKVEIAYKTACDACCKENGFKIPVDVYCIVEEKDDAYFIGKDDCNGLYWINKSDVIIFSKVEDDTREIDDLNIGQVIIYNVNLQLTTIDGKILPMGIFNIDKVLNNHGLIILKQDKLHEYWVNANTIKLINEQNSNMAYNLGEMIYIDNNVIGHQTVQSAIDKEYGIKIPIGNYVIEKIDSSGMLNIGSDINHPLYWINPNQLITNSFNQNGIKPKIGQTVFTNNDTKGYASKMEAINDNNEFMVNDGSYLVVENDIEKQTIALGKQSDETMFWTKTDLIDVNRLSPFSIGDNVLVSSDTIGYQTVDGLLTNQNGVTVYKRVYYVIEIEPNSKIVAIGQNKGKIDFWVNEDNLVKTNARINYKYNIGDKLIIDRYVRGYYSLNQLKKRQNPRVVAKGEYYINQIDQKTGFINIGKQKGKNQFWINWHN